MYSHYLAKIIGPFFFIIGISMVFYKKHYEDVMHEFLENPCLMAYSAMIGLVISLIIITLHNYWVGSWPTIITLIGWIGFFKSILFLFLRDHSKRLYRHLLKGKGYYWISWLYVIGGAYLGMRGFYV